MNVLFIFDRIQANDKLCALCTVCVRCCNLRETRQISSHQHCHFLMWSDHKRNAHKDEDLLKWRTEKLNIFCFINKTRTFSYTFSWQFFLASLSLRLCLFFCLTILARITVIYFCVARIEFHVYHEADVWSSFLLYKCLLQRSVFFGAVTLHNAFFGVPPRQICFALIVSCPLEKTAILVCNCEFSIVCFHSLRQKSPLMTADNRSD